MSSRLRGERGASLTEVIVASGLMFVVMTPVLFAVSTAQRHESSVDRLVRSVNGGRVALDRIVREGRRADGIAQAAPRTVQIWHDRNGDGSEDLDEVSVFEISPSQGTLLRRHAGRTETLIEGLDAARSSLSVSTVNEGRLLSVVLSIDLDPARPPGPTVLRTEVLARNG